MDKSFIAKVRDKLKQMRAGRVGINRLPRNLKVQIKQNIVKNINACK
jgi:hypothetical protein